VKSSTWFKLVLFPILLPLSILYGLGAVIKKKFSALNQVVLGPPVFSVGNFTVGGTGKTPLVTLLVQILKDAGREPILISKSYKGSLKIPAEVMLDSKVSAVGDEAFLLKQTFPGLKVYSGPHKTKTALFASSKIIDSLNTVFVIDDGAQHHGLYKSFKIHVWDMSLHKLETFPFPLGMAREFWFLGESPDLTILNRSKSPDVESTQDVPKVLRAHYTVQKISNAAKSLLNTDFILISGIGNFDQLEKAIDLYISQTSLKRIKSVKGRDHDDFVWFKPEALLSYVCTKKDYEKLKSRVPSERLFVVESEFSENFKKGFERSIHNFLKGE